MQTNYEFSNFSDHLLLLLHLGSLAIPCSVTHKSNISWTGETRRKGKKKKIERFKYFLSHSTNNVAQLQLLEKAKRRIATEGPITNQLVEGIEGNRADKLTVTSGTIWSILRNSPSNCDASKTRTNRILYSSSTEKEARSPVSDIYSFPNLKETNSSRVSNSGHTSSLCKLPHSLLSWYRTPNLCEVSSPVSDTAQK